MPILDLLNARHLARVDNVVLFDDTDGPDLLATWQRLVDAGMVQHIAHSSAIPRGLTYPTCDRSSGTTLDSKQLKACRAARAKRVRDDRAQLMSSVGRYVIEPPR